MKWRAWRLIAKNPGIISDDDRLRPARPGHYSTSGYQLTCLPEPKCPARDLCLQCDNDLAGDVSSVCPECGYDLHGIPDVRCPECGFHYDAQALRAMATYDERARLAVARILIARAMVAAALAVPAGCLSVGFRGWGTVFLLAVFFLGAFGTWAAYTNRYDGLESIPGLSIPCCGAVVFYSLGSSIFPLGLLIFSAFVLVTVWVIRLRHCPAPPPPSNVRYADLHHSAQRQCLVGDILLAAATLLVLAVSLHVT